MGALRRLARLIWSDDVDPALRPVLGVTLASTAAGSAMWSFMAIWAVDELGAKRELPYALLVGALLAGLSGFLGGYLSDRIGRRRVILVGQGIMVGYPIVLLLLSDLQVGRPVGPRPGGCVRLARRLDGAGDGRRPGGARAA